MAQPDKPACNNPKGKNQYDHCPTVDDPRIPEILRKYHRQGISDRSRLSKLLKDDHGIIMSESTISRRRRRLGLCASGHTTLSLPDAVKRQLVLDQMAKDPEGKLGAKTIKAMIFKDTGIDITRDWIRNEMRTLAPTAFASRRPHHKNSPEPPQSSDSRRTLEIPRQPIPRSTTSSGSRPQTTRVRRTVQQPLQNAAAVPLAPSPSLPPHPMHVDLYEGGSSANSPPLPPLLYSHDDTPSPHPSINANANGAFSCTPVILQPTSLACRPPAETSTPHSTSTTTPAALMDVINRTTPHLVSLTQSLDDVDLLGQPDMPPNLYESVLRCMEAAALLERQLSRVATGLKSTGS